MPDNTYQNVLERLKEYRSSKHLSQQQLGTLLGITQSEYCKVEAGYEKFLLSKLAILYKEQWDIDYIISGKHYKLYGKEKFSSLLENCDASQATLFYRYILQNFYLFWKHDDKKLEERCLYNELKILNMSYTDTGFDKELLRYMRYTEGLNKKDFGEVFGVSGKMYRKYEEGMSQLAAEHLLTMYKNGLCLPSFFLESRYRGLHMIEIMLQHMDEHRRQWFYDLFLQGYEQIVNQ